MGRQAKPRQTRCGQVVKNKTELWQHQTTCETCKALKFSSVSKKRTSRCGLTFDSASKYNAHAVACKSCLNTRKTTKKAGGWPCVCGEVLETNKARIEHREGCQKNRQSKIEEKILKLSDRYGTRKIAKTLDLPYSSVRTVLRKNGVKPKSVAQYSEETDKAVLEMVNNGIFVSIIAKRLGKSERFVRSTIKRLNVKRDSQRGRRLKNDKFSTSDINSLLKNSKVKVLTESNELIVSSIVELQCECGKRYSKKLHDVAFNGGPQYSCGCVKSKPQEDLLKFVQSFYPDAVGNEKQQIAPKHLDIYVPSKRFAIEYCGLLWHSTWTNKDSKYHQNKLKDCKSKAIDLVTIFEDEWISRQEAVLGYLKAKFGRFDERIHARKTTFCQIDWKEAKPFLDQNHIQGSVVGKHFGLFTDKELVAVATFNEIRNKRANLARYCVKIGHKINGGFAKLLVGATKFLGLNRLFTYADLRWTTGDVYKRNGWSLAVESGPTYYYITKHQKTRQHKMNFRLAKLRKRFGEEFCKGKTEKQICEDKGFYQIYDCGKQRWELDLTTGQNNSNNRNTTNLEEV